jgi:transcriptional regulator with XRE-family HTH domain
MPPKIKHIDGYSFSEGLKEAVDSVEYYQEGLLEEVSISLQKAMNEQGLKRKDLANILGTSPSYITKVLRGHANLSLESLAKFAFALNLQVSPVMLPLGHKVGMYIMEHTISICEAADGASWTNSKQTRTQWTATDFTETSKRTENHDVRIKIPA